MIDGMDNLARQPAPAVRPARVYLPAHDKPLKRYTYADYLRWDDDIRRELIDGKVYMMSAPTWEHQGVLLELAWQFQNYLRGKTCQVRFAPLDVRLFADPATADEDLSDRDVVQPDLVVICDPRKMRRRGCCGAPDLVVEVLSPSTLSIDMLVKFNKYLEAGVREYWIVDTASRVLLAHTLVESPEGRFYRTDAYGAEAQVKVGVLADCVIDLSAVFFTDAAAAPASPDNA